MHIFRVDNRLAFVCQLNTAAAIDQLVARFHFVRVRLTLRGDGLPFQFLGHFRSSLPKGPRCRNSLTKKRLSAC